MGFSKAVLVSILFLISDLAVAGIFHKVTDPKTCD